MCDNGTDSGTFESVPDQYMAQEMCYKAVDNYAVTLKFFS